MRLKCDTQESVTIRAYDLPATAYPGNMQRVLLAYGICSVFAAPSNHFDSPVTIALIGSMKGSNAVLYPYSPANYFHASSAPSVLTVFPPVGKAINVPLPFALGYVVFGPDGKSLYATGGFDPGKQNETRRGLLKIEFNPTRVSNVPGSLDFGIFGFAVSLREDKIIISGRHLEQGSQSCGVFELNLPGGDVRQVLQSGDCGYRSAWTDLSLSPSGEQAVALHNRRLELLDLMNGTSKSVGSDFWTGAWAPNGK